jgi:glycine C-acetyltransferase
MSANPADYSLADFYISDSPDVLQAPESFRHWLDAADWAISQYEPCFSAGPTARTLLGTGAGARSVINLSSYNYLGMASHPAVLRAMQDAMLRYGTGACGPPMLSGRTDLHARLEQKLASFLKQEAAALFSTGFSGGLAAVSGLARRGDVVVADSLAHMCVVDGVKLAGARLEYFQHNDPEDLDRVLAATKGKRRLVTVEGVYSMDGDMAALPQLLDVAEAHDVPVFIDEAHSILACGPTGGGVTEHFGAQRRIGIQFATCSKAFASLGGFTVGAKDTLHYMRYYAHPYTFSACMPPYIAAGMLAVLDLNGKEPGLRDTLRSNADYFRAQVRSLGLSTGNSTTHIVPIVVGEDRRLLYEACALMRERGLFVPPIDYPTVPQDQVRYRCSITAAHTRQDLDEALDIIACTLVPMMRAKGGLCQGV